ncbi:hypothetical protein DV735_g3060, partial [Chaetothyriales sp. CBS 134920]
MALRYDPEWYKLAEPVLQASAQAIKPALGDVTQRRLNVETLIAPLYARIPVAADVESTKIKITSYDGAEIELVRFSKVGATPGPAIIHLHGGGMIAGSVEAFSTPIKNYTSATGVQFFSVEYRLAPEHPDPTPVEDSYSALLWLHKHAAEFGIDPARIGVIGESAGAGLAAGVALLARDRKLEPPLAKQILVYPMLDSRNLSHEKNKALAPFLVWSVDSNITGWQALLGDRLGTDKVSPYASPAHAKDVSGLPSTYIDTGDLDLFRDEDIAYLGRIAAANVSVEFHIYPGVPHAFEVLAPQAPVTQAAIANRIRAIKSI